MTDAERIEQLKTTPPHPPLTRWQKIGRAVSAVCSVIAVAALCISIYGVHRAWETAQCVNGTLGDRAPVTQADARAHVDWSRALANLLAQPRDEALYTAFVHQTNAYVATLAADQDYRRQHPLGRC